MSKKSCSCLYSEVILKNYFLDGQFILPLIVWYIYCSGNPATYRNKKLRNRSMSVISFNSWISWFWSWKKESKSYPKNSSIILRTIEDCTIIISKRWNIIRTHSFRPWEKIWSNKLLNTLCHSYFACPLFLDSVECVVEISKAEFKSKRHLYGIFICCGCIR